MQHPPENLRHLKNGATLLGKFHPTNYIVAIYKSAQQRVEATEALRVAGFREEDILLCSAPEVQANLDENVKNEGVLNRFLNSFADPDDFLAAMNLFTHKVGYEFLLIYAPSVESTAAAKAIVATQAVHARKYALLASEPIACHGGTEEDDAFESHGQIDKVCEALRGGNLPIN